MSVIRRRLAETIVAPAAVLALVACGGSDGAAPAEASTPVEVGEPPSFVTDVIAAIDAVEEQVGEDQEFFEVTANDQFTNVFLAVDDGTAAVAYAYVDGELQPPAPKQTGAEGRTFVRDDVDFDPETVTAGIAAELPDSVVDAISVYGDGDGATYVVAVTSSSGGFLDVVVGTDGQVLSVDPV